MTSAERIALMESWGWWPGADDTPPQAALSRLYGKLHHLWRDVERTPAREEAVLALIWRLQEVVAAALKDLGAEGSAAASKELLEVLDRELDAAFERMASLPATEQEGV